MLVTVQEAPAEPGSKCLCMARRPRLKYHMDYCMEHPEELSRVAGLQKKVDEVKNVMVDNIEQVRPAILHAACQPCRPRSRIMKRGRTSSCPGIADAWRSR